MKSQFLNKSTLLLILSLHLVLSVIVGVVMTAFYNL